ncbi:hypothetical protein BDF19DRAFT_412834 [Syncephalis fuscata]|nr:hypothetical protein BDF19DRAFT_412834 [Syncephalis fuscata]
MQLEWITEMGLLPITDSDSDALSDCQLSFRRAAVRLVTTYLAPPLSTFTSKSAQPAPRITTVAQARWCMAAIGQVFALPSYADSALMNDAADIYSKWLLERNARPECYRSIDTEDTKEGIQSQQFLQTLFRHLSQLFEPRSFHDHPSGHPTTPAPVSPSGTSVFSMSENNTNIGIVMDPPLTGTSGTHTTNTNAATHTSSEVQDRSSAFREYAELCRKVLKMFTMAGRLLTGEMSESTWRVLIRVVSGACDRLLRMPAVMETLAANHATGHPIETLNSAGGSVHNMNYSNSNTGVTGGETRSELMAAGIIPEVYDLAGELCESLIQTLFELLLRAPSYDAELTDYLIDAFPHWAHRARVIDNWCVYSYAMTQRILRILYGPGAGTSCIEVTANSAMIRLDPTENLLLPIWVRTLNMIGDPCRLQPHNFEKAFHGIARIIKTFIVVGGASSDPIKTPGNPLPPDGNTIFRLFGTWLFDVCSTRWQDPRQIEGKMIALGALCRVFSAPQRRTRLGNEYLQRFYQIIVESSQTRCSIPALLSEGDMLLAADLEGVTTIVPYLVHAVRCILPWMAPGLPESKMGYYQTWRVAAIRHLTTLVCLPHGLAHLTLPKQWTPFPNDSGHHHRSETAVMNRIAELYGRQCNTLPSNTYESLNPSITNEANPFNFTRLVRLAQVFVMVDDGRTNGLITVVVRTILDKVLTEELPPMATSQGFDVLTDLASWSKQYGRFDIDCARQVIFSICRMIQSAFTNTRSDMQMIHSAYETVLRWAGASRHLAEDSSICRTVLQTFEHAIRMATQQIHRAERPASSSAATTSQQDHGMSWRVKRDIKRLARTRAMSLTAHGQGQHTTTAATTMNAATSIISSYPTLIAGVELSSEANFIQWELKIHLNRFMDMVRRSRDLCNPIIDNIDDITPLRRLLEQQQQQQQSASIADHGIRFILVDHRIVVGFVEKSTTTEELALSSTEDEIIIVFRDLMGKHVSRATSRLATSDFLEQHLPAESSGSIAVSDANREQRQPRPAPPTPPAPPRVARVEAVNEQYIPAFDRMFNEGTESARAAELVDQLMKDQSELEKNHPLPLSTTVFESSYVYPPKPRQASNPTQLFRQFAAQIGYLRKESRGDVAVLPLNHKLLDTLSDFDTIPTRDIIGVSIYYARTQPTTKERLIDPELNGSISLEFDRFLGSLGRQVPACAKQLSISTADENEDWAQQLLSGTVIHQSSDEADFQFHTPYLLPGCVVTEDICSSDAWNTFRRSSTLDALTCLWVQEDPAGAFEFINTHLLTEQSTAVGCIIIHPLPCLPGLYWLRIVQRQAATTTTTTNGGNGHTSVYYADSPTTASSIQSPHSQHQHTNSISGAAGYGYTSTGASNTTSTNPHTTSTTNNANNSNSNNSNSSAMGHGNSHGSATFGPLLNGMIATAQSLPGLIRGAALHAHRQQPARRDWRRLDAYVRRQQLLEEMSKNYALATPFNEFFEHVFVDD